MQYQFIAAALVASAMAMPSYQPPAYEAPAPAPYPSSEAPVYKPTSEVVYEPTHEAPTYPVKTETHPVVYPTKSEEHKYSTACSSKVVKETHPVVYEHGKVITITKTLTKTYDNKPTTYVETVYETHPAKEYVTKTAEKPVYTKPVEYTKVVEKPVETVPVYPEAPKPSAPVYEAPKPSAPVYEQPPVYVHPTPSNATAPSYNNGTKSYPTSPVKYTGAASSLSAAGFVAGFGAIVAFFL